MSSRLFGAVVLFVLMDVFMGAGILTARSQADVPILRGGNIVIMSAQNLTTLNLTGQSYCSMTLSGSGSATLTPMISYDGGSTFNVFSPIGAQTTNGTYESVLKATATNFFVAVTSVSGTVGAYEVCAGTKAASVSYLTPITVIPTGVQNVEVVNSPGQSVPIACATLYPCGLPTPGSLPPETTSTESPQPVQTTLPVSAFLYGYNGSGHWFPAGNAANAISIQVRECGIIGGPCTQATAYPFGLAGGSFSGAALPVTDPCYFISGVALSLGSTYVWRCDTNGYHEVTFPSPQPVTIASSVPLTVNTPAPCATPLCAMIVYPGITPWPVITPPPTVVPTPIPTLSPVAVPTQTTVPLPTPLNAIPEISVLYAFQGTPAGVVAPGPVWAGGTDSNISAHPPLNVIPCNAGSGVCVFPSPYPTASAGGSYSGTTLGALPVWDACLFTTSTLAITSGNFTMKTCDVTGAQRVDVVNIPQVNDAGSLSTPAPAATSTIIKATSGTIMFAMVTTAGTTGDFTCYDNASAASGTVIGYISATNGSVKGYTAAFRFHAANGIFCVSAASGPAVTIGFF